MNDSKPKENRNRPSGSEGRPPRRRRRSSGNSGSSGASNNSGTPKKNTGGRGNRQSQSSKRNSDTRNDANRRNRPRKRQPRKKQQNISKNGKLHVLILGAGGREHTLAWKLAQSPKVGKIFAFPGSAAISELGQSITIKPESFKQNVKQIAQFASRNSIDLTVVGPEVPLASGIVDEFKRRNLRIFGPTKAASELEWSKVFAKQFMRRHSIPTSSFKAFESTDAAITFCRTTEYPLVIKADGLAAGKGVLIIDSFEEAKTAIDDIMTRKLFGSAGKRILVEEFITGKEVSIMAFSDGENFWPMIPSQDHKRIGEGDTGPNTGGMGAYAPATFLTPELMETIKENILAPCIKGMAAEGRPFKGILYAGVMLTESGPKTLEFNCRFGDPETQVVLPLLESDLAEIMMTIADHKLPADPSKKSGKRKSSSSSKDKDKGKKKDEASKSDDEAFVKQGPTYLRDLLSDYEPIEDELIEDEPDSVQASKPKKLNIIWRDGAAASITLAARNYPGKPELGAKISGLEKNKQSNKQSKTQPRAKSQPQPQPQPQSSTPQGASIIFHAGTKRHNGAWVTSGGRVLNVSGLGKDVAEALQNAYKAVDKIRFDGMQFRRDIGHQALEPKTPVNAE